MKQVITETANSYVKQNIPCLEHCLKKLSKGLESYMVSVIILSPGCVHVRVVHTRSVVMYI